jgi:hypothetical protein
MSQIRSVIFCIGRENATEKNILGLEEQNILGLEGRKGQSKRERKEKSAVEWSGVERRERRVKNAEENRECFDGILFEFRMAMHNFACVGLVFYNMCFLFFFFLLWFVFFFVCFQFVFSPFCLVFWGQSGMRSVERIKDIRVR